MQTYQNQFDESEDSTIQIKMELVPVELGRALLFKSQEKNPASDVSPAAAGSGQEAWATTIPSLTFKTGTDKAKYIVGY
jgi:hypothetical protein